MKLKITEYLNSKTFRFGKQFLIILLVAAAAIPFQNCSPPPDDDIPIVDTTKKDTTKPKVEPINYFKVNGIDIYNLKWDSLNMSGWYKVGTNLTTIRVTGYSNANKAVFLLTFPGKATGTYKYSIDPKTTIEVETGEGVKYKKYVFEPVAGRDMTITVSSYGAVDGRIKGTFDGFLQESSSITAGNIQAGKFEVWRDTDEL